MKKIYHRSVYTKNDSGNIFFMALLFPAVFYMILLSVLTTFFSLSNNSGNSENYNLIISIISIISAQGGMFLIYLLHNKIIKANFLKASHISFKLNFVNVFLAVLFGAVVLFGLNNFISVFDALFQKMGHIAKDFPLPLNNGWWFAFNIVLLALLPAIVEELVFRGVIYNGLKQYGKVTAIVLSSILFALIHGNIDQTVYPILFGLVLAYIVYKTDNIVYSMIAHFVNNAVVLTFNFIYTLNPHLVEDVHINEFLTSSYVLIAVGLLIVSFVFIYFAGKLFKKKTSPAALSLLEETSDNIIVENLQQLESSNLKADVPNGVDSKMWEKIICQKNDIYALETAKKSVNVLLWVGIGISVLFWLISL